MTMIAPGPRGKLIFGILSDYRKDPGAYLARMVAEHGDVVRLPMVATVHLLRHPDHVQHVLQGNQGNYGISFLYKRGRPVVGNGLVTSDGAPWLKRRRLLSPGFTRERILTCAGPTFRWTRTFIERWAGPEGKRPVDLLVEMTRLSLAIAGDNLFGIDLLGQAAHVTSAIHEATSIINERFTRLVVWPGFLPTPENRRLRRAVAVLDEVVYRIIRERRGSAEAPDDLLTMLLALRDEETGEGMNDRELRDEVLTLLITSHETVALALAWAFHYLSLDEEADRRFIAEVESVTGGREPGLDDLPRLEYTTRLFHEALRLQPPLWLFSRTAIEPDEIGGYRIPAGGTVLLSPWLTHRHPGFWSDPESFEPDRFLPERSGDRHRYAYFPFAAGPRKCMGTHLALLEGVLILAMIGQRFRFEPAAGAPVRPRFGVLVTPQPGVPVLLRER